MNLMLELFVSILKKIMFKKMEVVFISVILLKCVCFSDSKNPLASYIHPCSRSAPDFEDCCLAHGKEALSSMLQGDKKYNIPVLTPFVSPLVSVDTGSLKVKIRDLHLYGLETNELKQVKFDLNNKKITLKIFFDHINITGDFELDGKIVMIPLEGSGKVSLSADGLDVLYAITYKLVERDGDEYIVVDTSMADFTCERLYVDVGDILGTKEIGETVNKALNDNWQELLEALRPVVTDTITEIGDNIINGFGASMVFADLFLV